MHKKRMESLDMVENIRRLNMKVKICKYDNERMFENSRDKKLSKHLATPKLQSFEK